MITSLILRWPRSLCSHKSAQRLFAHVFHGNEVTDVIYRQFNTQLACTLSACFTVIFSKERKCFGSLQKQWKFLFYSLMKHVWALFIHCFCNFHMLKVVYVRFLKCRILQNFIIITSLITLCKTSINLHNCRVNK